MATLDSGKTIVAWTTESEEGANSGVEARVLTGSKMGEVFSLARGGDARHWGQQIAALGGERFAVLWNSSGRDQPGQGIYGRSFSGERSGGGPVFRVNVFGEGDQRMGALGRLSGGRMAVAWQSHGQDGDGWGVYARVLKLRRP